ncbi:hypothetical protein M2454_001908 [Aequitasia blattaphilus]|uniref:Bacteriophage Gp15 family protein n=1 Tax=Aequitasia blattaphilus TaxID=2949332 RepID=A0ABT1EA93_9FIRM|nr:bacteriophage Gp15 family protein [Aequitasia blattaphilus]MCP1102596.1 bacteriophage Gp15 family protein [Aequitasia blattaphilus]MCR8615236.1 bacteriophage Gp15 family protein [Aequitasia blattaphilus]
MFSLAYKPETDIEIDGKIYPVDDSFDNVIRLIDMLNDVMVEPAYKVIIGLQMFLGDLDGDELLERDFNELNKVFNQLIELFIGKGKEEIKYDIAGNELPQMKDPEERNYSLKHDAEFIYASFMQAYGIDLIEEQGKLSWTKFQALLSGLPSNTKFSQVVSIRTWKKPSKNEKEHTRMAKLKEIYRLPEEEEGE